MRVTHRGACVEETTATMARAARALRVRLHIVAALDAAQLAMRVQSNFLSRRWAWHATNLARLLAVPNSQMASFFSGCRR